MVSRHSRNHEFSILSWCFSSYPRRGLRLVPKRSLQESVAGLSSAGGGGRGGGEGGRRKRSAWGARPRR
ncbi:hypothetical protein BHE74_00034111, partial [Ensete ventricosum]